MTDLNARWRREARRDGFDTMTMERQHRLLRLRWVRFLRLLVRESGLAAVCDWLLEKID